MRHVSFDIETTGLSPKDSKVVAIAVARDRRRSQKFDRQVLLTENLTEQEILELFVDEMEKLDSGSKMVTYNGDTFDWPFLIARSMEFDDYGEVTDKLFQLKQKHGMTCSRIMAVTLMEAM